MKLLGILRVSAVVLVLAVQACSPALNWREVRVNAGPLRALFPCRPDQGAQSVALGDRSVNMSMMGCEAGGAMFTLAHVDHGSAEDGEALLALWQSGTLASMQGVQTRQAPFLLKKVSDTPAPRQIRATGKRADGSLVVLQAAWFVVGGVIYQAAVYSDHDNEEVVQSYFEGLWVDK